MKFLTLILCLALTGLASAEEVRMPADQDYNYVSLFAADKADVQKLDAMIRSYPAVRQAHYNLIRESDPQYPRWKASITALPSFVVQDANGKVLYKVSGNKVPASPHDLAAIFSAPTARRQRYCIRGNGPLMICRPQPVVPDTQPVVPDTQPVVPDTQPVVPDTETPIVDEQPERRMPVWAWLLAILTGGGAAVVPEVKRRLDAISY